VRLASSHLAVMALEHVLHRELHDAWLAAIADYSKGGGVA